MDKPAYGVDNRGMATALMITLAAVGLVLFFSPYYMAGFVFMGLAAIAGRSSDARSEDIFITVLAALAFLGIVAVLVEDLIGRFLLS